MSANALSSLSAKHVALSAAEIAAGFAFLSSDGRRITRDDVSTLLETLLPHVTDSMYKILSGSDGGRSRDDRDISFVALRKLLLGRKHLCNIEWGEIGQIIQSASSRPSTSLQSLSSHAYKADGNSIAETSRQFVPLKGAAPNNPLLPIIDSTAQSVSQSAQQRSVQHTTLHSDVDAARSSQSNVLFDKQHLRQLLYSVQDFTALQHKQGRGQLHSRLAGSMRVKGNPRGVRNSVQLSERPKTGEKPVVITSMEVITPKAVADHDTSSVSIDRAKENVNQPISKSLKGRRVSKYTRNTSLTLGGLAGATTADTTSSYMASFLLPDDELTVLQAIDKDLDGMIGLSDWIDIRSLLLADKELAQLISNTS